MRRIRSFAGEARRQHKKPSLALSKQRCPIQGPFSHTNPRISEAQINQRQNCPFLDLKKETDKGTATSQRNSFSSYTIYKAPLELYSLVKFESQGSSGLCPSFFQLESMRNHVLKLLQERNERDSLTPLPFPKNFSKNLEFKQEYLQNPQEK